MVRTRAKKGSNTVSQKNGASVPEPSQESWKLWLMDFQNELDGRLQKLQEKVNEELATLDRCLLVTLTEIPAEEANLPPKSVDLCDSVESFDETLTSTVKKVGKGFITSTAFKQIPSTPPKTTRQSRAKTKRNRTSSLTDVSAVYPDLSSTRRMTRSSSQPRPVPHHFITDYQTPMNRPDTTMKSVTPKVDPYCPMPLKRFARQGEMAISLTGSPLMMTTSISEPNICLPLNNGQEVYSILPTQGPCPEIPSIDNQTREKLRILRENLTKILGE